MNEQNPYAPPAAELVISEPAEEKTPQGIGGWLVLVAIGIVVSPLRIMFLVFPTYIKLVVDGTWAAMTTKGSAGYNPLFVSVLSIEIVVNLALLLAWLYLAFLFFSKRKGFPKGYILISVITLLFQLLDTWIIQLLIPGEKAFDPESIKEISRTVISCLIWIPYMVLSKRVKATFVR